LESKTIRAVGEPAKRFKEDYSRLLRGLRQACQLNFEFDPETYQTIKKTIKTLLEKKKDDTWVVPRETIAKELIKAFRGDPVRAFDLCDETGVFKTLIPEIADLKECPQPEEFHSEGNAFVHTRLNLERLKSEGYQKTFGDKTLSAELVWAILLHDIGKLPSLKTPEKDGTDRIRFDGHNETGAQMATEIINRLKLESMPDGTLDHISADKISWLIKNHLLLLNADPKTMRASTIEKYFFNPLAPGDELMRLAYCDGMATIPKNGEPGMTIFKQMLKRIKEVGKLAAERDRLPPPLLNGEEIMKALKIKPGPQVGKVIEALRNAQLEGQINSVDEALEAIKKMI
jgi:poly(A) polymerase